MSESTALAPMPIESSVKVVPRQSASDIMETVIARGDLSDLKPGERARYYVAVCESMGLNPLTKPFDYIELDGKLTLYPTRGATDQLRKIYNVSIVIVDRKIIEGVYVVTARATMPDGRTDESTGAVPIVKEGGTWETAQSGKRYFKGNGEFSPLSPADRANVLMKTETKAKRRATLSAIGLPFLDESELDTVRGARAVVVDHETGEIFGDLADSLTGGTHTAADSGTSQENRERAMKALHAATRTKDKVDKFPGQPDVHAVLRELAIPGFNVKSMSDLTVAQLTTLRTWVNAQAPNVALEKLDVVRSFAACQDVDEIEAVALSVKERNLGDDLMRAVCRHYKAALSHEQPIDVAHTVIDDDAPPVESPVITDDEGARIEWRERIDGVAQDGDQGRREAGWHTLVGDAGADEYRWAEMHRRAPSMAMLRWIAERCLEAKMRGDLVFLAELARTKELAQTQTPTRNGSRNG